MNLIRSNLQYLRKYVRWVDAPIGVDLSRDPHQYLFAWGVFGSDAIYVYGSRVVLCTGRDRLPDNVPHAWRNDL